MLLIFILIAALFIWIAIINSFGKFKREILLMSLFAIFFAASAAYHPAAWLNSQYLLLNGIVPGSTTITRTTMMFYSAFVGINEELLKCLATLVIIITSPYYTRPLHGYIYAASTGLGFGILENFFYLNQLDLQTLLLRINIATPFHIFLALIWAVGINNARFSRTSYTKSIAPYLLISATLHGFYNHQAIFSNSLTESALKTTAILFFTVFISFLVIIPRQKATY